MDYCTIKDLQRHYLLSRQMEAATAALATSQSDYKRRLITRSLDMLSQEANPILSRINNTLPLLTSREAELVNLRYVLGYTFRQAAAYMNRHEQTVYSLRRHLIRHLNAINHSKL